MAALTDTQLVDAQTITPPEITETIVAFCKEIIPATGSKPGPVYVPVEPKPHVALNSCFSVTQRKAENEGSAVLCGWTLAETRDLMLEADFHAVWWGWTTWSSSTPITRGCTSGPRPNRRRRGIR